MKEYHEFNSELELNKHLKYLYAKGEIYTIFNNNLLFHGCVPVNEKGNLKEIKFFSQGISFFTISNSLASFP
mgnify:CR=1 FL=1